MIVGELIHLLITTIVAVFVFWRWRSWKLVILCYIVGLLIDLDHLFDYYHFAGLSHLLDIKGFFTSNFFEKSAKIYVLFHGWEYVIILGLLGWKFKKYRQIFFTISLALIGHLLVDQFSYHTHLLTYSLIYRAAHHFSLNICF